MGDRIAGSGGCAGAIRSASKNHGRHGEPSVRDCVGRVRGRRDSRAQRRPYLDDGASELNDSLVFDGADALSEIHPRELDVLF